MAVFVGRRAWVGRPFPGTAVDLRAPLAASGDLEAARSEWPEAAAWDLEVAFTAAVSEASMVAVCLRGGHR